MAISPWAIVSPTGYASAKLHLGANKALGNPAGQMVDDVAGAYGYQDFGPQQEMLNAWYNMQKQDLEKNSNVNQLEQVYGKLGDEANSAAAASAQTNVDQARMYGATSGQLERALNQKGMNQLNVTADLGKQKAQDLWGAQREDNAARRALESQNMQGKLTLEGQRLASYQRRGGILGGILG